MINCVSHLKYAFSAEANYAVTSLQLAYTLGDLFFDVEVAEPLVLLHCKRVISAVTECLNQLVGARIATQVNFISLQTEERLSPGVASLGVGYHLYLIDDCDVVSFV